jgi:hypothetical protein
MRLLRAQELPWPAAVQAGLHGLFSSNSSSSSRKCQTGKQALVLWKSLAFHGVGHLLCCGLQMAAQQQV